MADPRSLPHDQLSRRWETVEPVKYCPRCLGGLPADVESACSSCGTGTPQGLVVVGPHQVVVERDEDGRWTSARTVAADESVTAEVEQDAAETPTPAAPAEPVGWMTLLKSWARWPNA